MLLFHLNSRNGYNTNNNINAAFDFWPLLNGGNWQYKDSVQFCSPSFSNKTPQSKGRCVITAL